VQPPGFGAGLAGLAEQPSWSGERADVQALQLGAGAGPGRGGVGGAGSGAAVASVKYLRSVADRPVSAGCDSASAQLLYRMLDCGLPDEGT
jgi:hypothetical protein